MIKTKPSRKLRRGWPRMDAISQVIVQGYKSLAGPEPYRIAVQPLTLLAGANSSGKSSAIQPLLLLKQTLEASFDPGPLLLHGPHVRFTSTRQFIPADSGLSNDGELSIGIKTKADSGLTSYFEARSENEIELRKMSFYDGEKEIGLDESLSHADVRKIVPAPYEELRKSLEKESDVELILEVFRRRCFFDVGVVPRKKNIGLVLSIPEIGPSTFMEQFILEMIHVPGMRGNPERSYRTTAVGPMYPGTFENYVASIIHQWQTGDSHRMKKLWSGLVKLGLTWKVTSKQLDASKVEISVGRLPHAKRGGARDLVNIADVGFGVSQVLPVLVALLAARPGQLVYLEQPEIHLHPKAQVALAELLVEAANRGVRVVAETHSALLLLAVQALVAEKRINPQDVILHWFRRNASGVTEIQTAELDEQGAYGDWPEDFGEIELAAQSRYMNAVESQLFQAVGA